MAVAAASAFLPADATAASLASAAAAAAAIVLLVTQAVRVARRLPPSAGGWVPIVGLAVPFGAAPGRLLRALRRLYGPVFELSLGPVRVTVVDDPAFTKKLYASRAPQASFYAAMQKGMLTKNDLGEFFLAVPEARENNLIVDSLASQGVPAMRRAAAPAAAAEADRLVERLAATPRDSEQSESGSASESAAGDAAGDLDPVATLQTVSVGATAAALVGERAAEAVREPGAGGVGAGMSRYMDHLRSSLFAVFPPGAAAAAADASRVEREGIERALGPSVDAARAPAAAGKLPWMERLFSEQARYGAGGTGETSPFSAWGHARAHTDAEMAKDIMGVLFATAANTPAGQALTLMHILADPALQARCRAEADAAAAAGSFEVASLPVTHAVAREVVRLYPGTLHIRQLGDEDWEACGYRLKARSLVAVAPHIANTDASVYDDPYTFDPDRWLPTPPTLDQAAPGAVPRHRRPAGGSVPPHAYVTFGRGTHKCLGEVMAWTEMVVPAAKLLAALDLELVRRGSAAAAAAAAPRPGGLFDVDYRSTGIPLPGKAWRVRVVGRRGEA